jgi:hypothetical protein
MQFDKPIAYLSKAIGEKNRAMPIYEKEFLALMLVVDKWKQYSQHSEFIIKTDHRALSFLEDQTRHSDYQRKVMAKLMGLQFKIVYRKGMENKVVDALSRVGHLMVVTAVSSIQPQWIQVVINSYTTVEVAQQLLAKLAVHSPDERGFSLNQGIIRKDSHIYIGENSALKTKLIFVLHGSVVGGHFGILATYHMISKLFRWKGLKSDVEQFMKQCFICQQAKSERIHPSGLLQPLPIPLGAWQDLSLDFIDGLSKSEGYSFILVMVDGYSKYAHFFPLKHPYTATQVTHIFLDNVVKLHGVPKSLVSDRDKIFFNSFLEPSVYSSLDQTCSEHCLSSLIRWPN